MNIPHPKINSPTIGIHAIKRTTILLFCVISITASAQIFDNETKLQTHKVFNSIEIGIPDILKPLGANKKKVSNELGFAHFENSDKSIKVEFRRIAEADLSLMKRITDSLSSTKIKWKVIKNELKDVNGIALLVTDVEGQTTFESSVTAIFIYYFNSKGSTYRLWMQYPLDILEKTEQLRTRMIEAIKIID